MLCTDITIDQLSHDGRGVAKIDGKVTFVWGALPQEIVDIEVTAEKKNFNEAMVTAIKKSHSNRVSPPCPHFGVCGGCRLQHLDHAAQMHFKEETVKEQLLHHLGIMPRVWLPSLMGSPYHYRRRARLSVKYVEKKQDLLIGFHEKNGRFVANMQQCEILAPPVGLLLPKIKQCLMTLSIMKQIPQIEVAVADNATCLILRHLAPFSTQDLNTLTNFSKENNVFFSLQEKKPEHIVPLATNPHPPLVTKIYEKCSASKENKKEIILHFLPTDFIQVNQAINKKMIQQALELLDIQPDEYILDLFSGIGNFSLPMALYAKKVVGLEGLPHLVQQASTNATLNQIENAEFATQDLSDASYPPPWQRCYYDSIVLDPPRSGAAHLATHLPDSHAKKILYISCDPATLIRDAGAILATGAYQLDAFGLIDMFPQTAHVESMALFKRK